jgi:VWFA-related protein
MAMRAAGAIVGLAVLLGAWSPSARAEPTRPLISLPLFVTDINGQSIRNLKAPDIEIAEGGIAQKVSSIAFRGGSTRRIALFLDEYHVSPGPSTDRARASVARFVERDLRPDDAVIVMKPLDPRAATAPVANIEAVHRAVADFDGRLGVYEPRGEFEAQYMSTAPPMVDLQRAQVVRAAMESLAISLRDDADASKALIIVTEGFKSNEATRMRTTTLRTIARAARLANVPVYIIDPAAEGAGKSPLNDAWRSMSDQTGGVLFPAGTDLDAAFSKVAADLQGHYMIEFQGAGKEDGGFHGIEVKVKRTGARVRAPSGYWAPFGPSRLPPINPAKPYANLLTPHVSGLIQPWFRMSPAPNGQTRVTFSWTPKPGRKVAPERVDFTAITFEGATLHTSSLAPLGVSSDVPSETSFVVSPGPLQISLAAQAVVGAGVSRPGALKQLDTDVRYIDVPRLDSSRPYIAAVEFVRPRSLPEFRAMQSDASVMPAETREFLRQDHLLVRVRAFTATGPSDVSVTLLNSIGQPLLELKRLRPVDGASQFELPFARYVKGDYRLLVTAGSGATAVRTILSIRVVG